MYVLAKAASLLVVVAAPQVAAAVGSDAMTWIVAGGLSYTVGAIFYVARGMPYSHAIWHLFVLGGGICHFLAVIWYVLPEPTLAVGSG